MTSWMKERDRLLEQTLAFVQGVAAQRPIQVAVSDPHVGEIAVAVESPAAQTVATEPLATDLPNYEPDVLKNDIACDAIDPPAPIDSEPPAPPPIAVSDAASSETDMLISLMALSQSTERPAPKSVSVAAKPLRPPQSKPPIELGLPERDVIAQRVARFRAAQQKIIQDRDDNYARVQAKIRSTLGKTPSV